MAVSTTAGGVSFADALTKKFSDDASDLDCIICLDTVSSEPIVMSCCGAVFCRPCIEQSLRQRPHCPKCRAPFNGAPSTLRVCTALETAVRLLARPSKKSHASQTSLQRCAAALKDAGDSFAAVSRDYGLMEENASALTLALQAAEERVVASDRREAETNQLVIDAAEQIRGWRSHHGDLERQLAALQHTLDDERRRSSAAAAAAAVASRAAPRGAAGDAAEAARLRAERDSMLGERHTLFMQSKAWEERALAAEAQLRADTPSGVAVGGGSRPRENHRGSASEAAPAPAAATHPPPPAAKVRRTPGDVRTVYGKL